MTAGTGHVPYSHRGRGSSLDDQRRPGFCSISPSTPAAARSQTQPPRERASARERHRRPELIVKTALAEARNDTLTDPTPRSSLTRRSSTLIRDGTGRRTREGASCDAATGQVAQADGGSAGRIMHRGRTCRRAIPLSRAQRSRPADHPPDRGRQQRDLQHRRRVGAENRVTAFHQRLRRAIGLVVTVHGRSCMVAHCGLLTRLPHTRPRAEPAGTARSIRFSEGTSRSCCCVTNWPCCGENTLAYLKDAKAGAAARTSREAAQPRPAQSHTHPSHDQPSPYDRSPNDATRSAVGRRPPDMREVQVPTAPPARADARA